MITILRKTVQVCAGLMPASACGFIDGPAARPPVRPKGTGGGRAGRDPRGWYQLVPQWERA